MLIFIITSTLTIYMEIQGKNKFFNAKLELFHATVMFFFFEHIFTRIYIIHGARNTLRFLIGFFFIKQFKKCFYDKIVFYHL